MAVKTKPAECLSIFGEEAVQPSEDGLRKVLGRAAPAWSELVTHVEATWPAVVEEWHFTGARYGWSMRLRLRGRNVLYLIPQAARFLVGIVLSAKAVAAAEHARLPARVVDALAKAPRYPEGTGLRLPVSRVTDLPPIRKLTALKMGS